MNQLEHNDFIYKNSACGEYIQHNKSKPNNIFKYYSMSKHSVDALLKGYLYASHPFDMNDTLDSNFSIYTSSKRISKNFYKNFYRSLKEEDIDQIYTEDLLNKKFIFDFYDRSSSLFGIISMATDANNDLFWAHYTQELGFQIMFNTTRLEKSIKDSLTENDDYIGFYPVNYCSEIKTINLSMLTDFLPAFLYITSIKKDCWGYENEWRFIIGKEDMNIPYTKFGLRQGTDIGNIENRYIYYEKKIVEQIVVGKHFFNGRVFIITPIGNKVWRLRLIEKENCDLDFYKKFLDYIIDNLSDKFFISEIVGIPSDSNFRIERKARKANITKDIENEYILSIINE